MNSALRFLKSEVNTHTHLPHHDNITRGKCPTRWALVSCVTHSHTHTSGGSGHTVPISANKCALVTDRMVSHDPGAPFFGGGTA